MTIVFWITATVSFAGLIIGILLVANVPIGTLTRGQGGVLVGFCPFATMFSLMMATIHYKVTDTHLQLKMAFWDILGGRIRIENIVSLVKKDNNLYVSFIWKGPDPVIARIAVRQQDYDRVKALLTDKNPAIFYYDEDKQTD